MKWVFCLAIFYITIKNVEAQEYTERDFRNAQSQKVVLVLLFIGNECPVSQQYVSVINRLREKYTISEVNIQGLIPGKIRRKDFVAFIRDYQPSFRLAADKNSFWVKNLNASTTPEVFIFDQSGKLKYQGAIDNWYFDLGRHRQEATENYAADAIDCILRGEIPFVGKTEAVGCIIQKPVRK